YNKRRPVHPDRTTDDANQSGICAFLLYRLSDLWPSRSPETTHGPRAFLRRRASSRQPNRQRPPARGFFPPAPPPPPTQPGTARPPPNRTPRTPANPVEIARADPNSPATRA